MARIDPPAKPGPITRLIYRIGKRQTGGGRMPEPVLIQSHAPLLMHGYGAFETAFAKSKHAPEKLKALAELKAAALAGCEWCMDFGSWLAKNESGVTEQQLRALPNFRDSDEFTEDEKLVLEYAEAMTRTPVDVPDELFARMRERFDEPAIVELTWAAAIENLRARFNWALGIDSQDYSEGAFCIRPESSNDEASSPAAA
jgi:alkylhydroperoxidase family enzyme